VDERDDRALLSPQRRRSDSAEVCSATPREVAMERAMSAKSIAGSVISQRKKTKSDLFYRTTDFWEKVVDVSRHLCSIVKNERNATLRDSLEHISKRYLPSSTICAPVGNVCHRVWAIHPSECFVFSTKDRVPFMICLEVLDYPRSQLELCRAALVHLDGHGVSDADSYDSTAFNYTQSRVVKYAKDCLSSGATTQRLEADLRDGVNVCLEYFPNTSSDQNDAVPIAALYSLVVDVDPFFGERWQDKETRLRQSSRIGHLRGWSLLPCIVKSSDDLRQEQFASYIIKQMHEIYVQCDVDCWTRPYDVVALSPDSGLIEVK